MVQDVVCEFKWDPGDASVGIPAGWNPEETAVHVMVPVDGTNGEWQLNAGFEPIEHKPVEEWPVTQVWVSFDVSVGSRVRSNQPFVEVDNPTMGSQPMVVGDLPAAMAQAVKAEWTRINDEGGH